MSKRGLGLVLVLMFAAASALLFQIVKLDRRAAAEREASDNLIRTIDRTQTALASLRAAQASVVAAGQGPDFWLKRAGDLSAEIERNLSDLTSRSSSTDARAEYDQAISALGVLNALDQKAREHVASGEPLIASDVVFADESESAQRLASSLDAAMLAEHNAATTVFVDVRRWRLGLEGGAIAALLLALIVVGVRGVRAPKAPQETTSLFQQPVVIPRAEPKPTPVPTPAPVPAPDLTEAADVCVDLARVLDGRDIPPLLARAADVLGAKGLVLWVADSAGQRLQASLGYGYSDKVLARLGSLETDADNMTSRTYRSLQPQTLSGQGGEALAVPLITSAGCIGVLAAELARANSGTQSVAIARMFAAQLATLVGPAAEPTTQAAQGV